MGRLAGFSGDDVIRKLRRVGFTFYRQGRGSHEVWRNTSTKGYAIIPRHPGDLPEGTVAGIVKQAKLSVDDFLAL